MYLTLAVLAMNGVSIIPVHTTLAVFTGGVVDTSQTLAGRLVAAQRVTYINVVITRALLTRPAHLQRVSPVPELTAITTDTRRITTDIHGQIMEDRTSYRRTSSVNISHRNNQ